MVSQDYRENRDNEMHYFAIIIIAKRD